MALWLKSDPTGDQLVSYPSGDNLYIPSLEEASSALSLPAMTAGGVAKAKAERPVTGSVEHPAMALAADVKRDIPWTADVDLPALEAAGNVKHGDFVGADADLSLPALTSAGSVKREVPWTGAFSLPGVEVDGVAGRVPVTISITASVSMPSIAISGSATPERQVSGDVDHPAMDVSALATREVLASGEVELPAFEQEGLTGPPNPTSGVIQNPAMTAAAQVNRDIAAPGAIDLSVLAISAAVQVERPVSGAVDLTAQGVQGAVDLTELQEVTGAIDFPALLAVGEVVLNPEPATHGVSGEIDLTALTLAGQTAQYDYEEAIAALTQAAMALSGVPEVSRPVEGALSLPALGVDGQAILGFVAAGDVSIALFEVDASARRIFETQAAAFLTSMEVDGEVGLSDTYSAQGDVDMPSFLASGFTEREILGSGDLDLPAFGASGAAHRQIEPAGVATMPAMGVYGVIRLEGEHETQIYRVIEIREVPGKPYKIAVLQATRRPINR